jgi:hypothetical protein
MAATACIRKSDLSNFVRGRIFALKFDAGWSYTEIANKLLISRNTVAKCCQRLSGGDPEPTGRNNCGSSKCTTERDERRIVRLSLANRFSTAADIKRGFFPNISVQTVRRRLCENGLSAHSPAKKPILNARIRTLRRDWACDHINWTLDDWSKLAFSDESAFSLSSNSVQYVRRRMNERYDEECVLSHENRSRGSCMIWGAFSTYDYTPLHRVQSGTLNSERYIQLLQQSLLPFLPNLLPNGGQFQQDNAPAHGSRATKTFLENHNVNVFPWPSTSPDMSPIENVWGRMECILKREYELPSNGDELFATLEEIWIDLMQNDQYRCDLINSMTTRVSSLYAASGGYTKY